MGRTRGDGAGEKAHDFAPFSVFEVYRNARLEAENLYYARHLFRVVAVSGELYLQRVPNNQPHTL